VAGEQLFELVYDELRRLARVVFVPDRNHNTLQPTALVHEAWLKMAGHVDSLVDRRHFFAVAARAMRQVLSNTVRDRQRQKRGGSHLTVQLDEAVTADVQTSGNPLDLAALDTALSKLTEKNERHARVVELRMLGTMTMQEIADQLDMPKRTVEADWTFARLWLRVELQDSD
jgi:RNA polymerase sigma factor (TIGR02999 family)